MYYSSTRMSVFFLVAAIGTLIFLQNAKLSSVGREYSIKKSQDGGYSLAIVVNKVWLVPISAEGPFPKARQTYQINLIGKGKDLAYQNQKGRYFLLEKMVNIGTPGDIGYAYVSGDDSSIHLNFYWLAFPDNIKPSDLNGQYKLIQPVGK